MSRALKSEDFLATTGSFTSAWLSPRESSGGLGLWGFRGFGFRVYRGLGFRVGGVHGLAS